jgi:hypothetical protein
MLRELHACMEAFGIRIKKSDLKKEIKKHGIKIGEGITYS